MDDKKLCMVSVPVVLHIFTLPEKETLSRTAIQVASEWSAKSKESFSHGNIGNTSDT
jgi:hypothetical protein